MFKLFALKNYIAVNGGATLDANGSACALSSGYMVSLAGSELKIKPKKLTKKIIKKYLIKAKMAGAYVGFWRNDGFIYVDLSVNIKNKMQAIQAGLKNNQLAIYDVKKDCSIFLNV